MKTLIINGSPRKEGNTVYIINIIKKTLKGEIETVDTYYDKISPCIDCRYCYTHKSCSIKDNMNNIYKQIIESDNIIIASPLHFNELSGSFLCFASRMQLFFSAKYIRRDMDTNINKKGFLVLTGGGSSKNADCAISTAKIILKEMGAELLKTISYLNTDKVPVSENNNIKEKIKGLCKEINL